MQQPPLPQSDEYVGNSFVGSIVILVQIWRREFASSEPTLATRILEQESSNFKALE
jgi:hypothetical protein